MRTVWSQAHGIDCLRSSAPDREVEILFYTSPRGTESLSHSTETYTPTELTFCTTLALAYSAIHTSIPLSVQYGCHSVGHFPSNKDVITHALGGYTQQERSALTIIPCDQTRLQHSGPCGQAPAPTHT